MSLSDILILAAVFCWAAVVIAKRIRDRKNGKCDGCGGDCSRCYKGK